MHPKNRLAPLTDPRRHEAHDYLLEDLESLRENRYHLKRYLSSNQLSAPHSKKQFELTESIVKNPGSPRIFRKLIESSSVHKASKEEYIDKVVAFKLANKSVMQSRNNFNPHKSLQKQQIFISVPEELKVLDKEGFTERSEIAGLIEWFEDSLKIIECKEREFLSMPVEDQQKIVQRSEVVFNKGLRRFLEVLQTHCVEHASFLSQFFVKYEKFWTLKRAEKNIAQENRICDLQILLDTHKTEMNDISKNSKIKISEIESALRVKEEENALKELEVKKLSKLVSILKEERTQKLVTQMEMYEKVIKEIKKQVTVNVIDLPNKLLDYLSEKSTKSTLLSELHLIPKTDDQEQSPLKDLSSEDLNLLSEEKLSDKPDIQDNFTQISVEFEDKSTNIGPVYFEEETQTYYIIDENHVNEVEDEIKELKDAGLIPPAAEIESWSAGYFTGLERAKTLEEKENSAMEEEAYESIEEDSIGDDPKKEEIVKSEKKEERIDYRLKRKIMTKIKAFNFQKREKVVQIKVLKSKKIREYFLRISQELSKKRAKMSKKMLMKTIHGVYLSLIPKAKHEEIPDDLLEYIFIDFETKNSMPKVVKRKMLDLLCSLVKYSEILTSRIFLKFLNMAEKTTDRPFLSIKDSLRVFLSGLDSILKSKSGIMIEFSDFSDTHFVPVIRILEFLKIEFFEIFPSFRYSKLLDFIEKNSSYDKTRLNNSGMICFEVALNFIMKQYEEHCSAVKKTGTIIMKALTCDNSPEFVRKIDLSFIVGLMKPGKLVKEIEGFSGEFVRCEEFLNGVGREVFPEEFGAESGGEDLDLEFWKTLGMLKEEKFFEKSQFVKNFLSCGRELGVEVFGYIRKIVELYRRSNHFSG